MVEGRTEVLPAQGKRKPKTKKVKETFVEMGVLALRRALTLEQGLLIPSFFRAVCQLRQAGRAQLSNSVKL